MNRDKKNAAMVTVALLLFLERYLPFNPFEAVHWIHFTCVQNLSTEGSILAFWSRVTKSKNGAYKVSSFSSI